LNNKRSIIFLFTANGISGFSQGISMIAIPWYFASKHASDVFNLAYAGITFFVLFFGLYAGVLVDKYSRKQNFLVLNSVCGLLLMMVAAAGFALQALPDWMVIAVFGITMLNYNVHYPTLYALGQEITEPAYYHRLNANIEIVGQSTSIISGAVGAMLLEGIQINQWNMGFIHIPMNIHLAKWEIWEIFLLDAITYFIAVSLIYFIRYTSNPLLHKQTGGIIKRIRAGISYLKLHRPVFVFGVFSYAVFAMLLVEIHAVLPGYVDRYLLEKGNVFAIADGIYAIGALSAGLFIGKLFTSKSTVKAVIILSIVTSIIFAGAFYFKSVWVLYTVSVILGFTNAGIRVLRMTYLFQHVPNELIGRVGSIFNMLNVLTRSIFIMICSTPFFHTGDQIRWAFLMMSFFILISATVLLAHYKKLVQ
jgi:MFS family permease